MASSRVGVRIRARGCGRAGAPARLSLGEPLDHGEDERGRLAGAGLGAGEQVASGQHERNRLALDGGGIGVALRLDGAEQFGTQPELREGHGKEAPDEALPVRS